MEFAPKRLSGFAVAAGAGAVLVAGGAGWLWLERTPIAASYIDEALAARGVAASYRLTRIGLRTQRIESIRLGDPARPDLTADWAEIELSLGFSGVSVRAIDARGVRLRGRLVDGKLSLGAIDRLLPAKTGDAPFALPDIALTARDMRVALETPAGAVRAVVDGQGGLANGFRGRVALASDRLLLGGCAVAAPRTLLRVEIADGRPQLEGPVGARSIRCGPAATITAPALDLSAEADKQLARWRGTLVVQRGAVQAGDARVARLGGRIGFDASATRITGEGAVFADGVAVGGSAVRRLAIEGGYRVDPASASASFVGEADATRAILDPTLADRLAAQLRGADGTPIGPIAIAWGEALRRAGRSVGGHATFTAQAGQGGATLQVERLDLTSASGARLLVRGERAEGLGWRWPEAGPMINASAELGGGGLPDARLSLRQPVPGAPLTGSATIAPYSIGDTRLRIAPVRFGPEAGGATLITTRVTMDGPLADGRIEGLDLPIAAHLGRGGALAINRTCAPLRFERLAVAGTDLARTSLPLCPIGGALFGRTAAGALYGGASIAAPRLRGRVGDQPLTMAAGALSVTVGTPGFALDALRVRLGSGPNPTRLDVGKLGGQVRSGGIAGRFESAEGRIGVVPLLLSGGAGDWRLAASVLTLKGALKVDDAQTVSPRFHQLAVPDVALTLKGGYITASGTLTEPRSGKPVATVRIAHALSSGRGDATLDVKGLRFTKGFQPERITPLTVGVVANVEGEVAGQGKIVWAGGNVTSTGVFRTEGLNLAAAFGPVTGLKGEIHFTDLIGMVTAPHQRVTLAEVNPGIAVTDGVVRYQLLADQKIAIEGGQWPFAGGTLSLDPTVMDFGAPVERRMLFRIDGLDSGTFIQQLEFKNLDVTGKFDGVLPIAFDAQGGRIEKGELKVRSGGGTLSYVGDVTNADLGAMARLAFDALKAMRYDRLTIELDGSLDGEIVSKVRFDGTNNAPKTATKPSGIVGRMLAPLTRLPFRFNITITAPFRGLVSSAQTFIDPSVVLKNVQVQPQAPAPANPSPDPIQPR